MPPMHQNYSIFLTSMPPMHQNNSILLDLNASTASELLTATTAAAAATAATAAAAAGSQELWNLGGALVQRAQEQNIPCGESLTSMNRYAQRPLNGFCGLWFGCMLTIQSKKKSPSQTETAVSGVLNSIPKPCYPDLVGWAQSDPKPIPLDC